MCDIYLIGRSIFIQVLLDEQVILAGINIYIFSALPFIYLPFVRGLCKKGILGILESSPASTHFRTS